MRRLAILALLLALPAGTAVAIDPGAKFADPAQEERARELFRELRCMVCQNQSIDDSDAPLAKDLRTLVRERMAAGESDKQIKAFLVARYGEFVLLRPRFGTETLILWGAPLMVLVAGVFVLAAVRRRGANPPDAALTAEERKKLEAILGDDA